MKVPFQMNILYQVMIALIILTSCSARDGSEDIRHGDLLFQDLDCGDLCDAIEIVTEGANGMDFSHCAMVVNVDDTLKVVEAIADAVQINSLKDFYTRSGQQTIAVGRVKNEYRHLLNKATDFTLKQVGVEYDHAFLLNNGKWYCSELLFESFRKANRDQDFFDLEPMTFKDPKTNDYFPAWIDYYSQLGEEIPEGKAGLNPGSISRSDKIEIIQIQ
jgi:hypothetical protein